MDGETLGVEARTLERGTWSHGAPTSNPAIRRQDIFPATESPLQHLPPPPSRRGANEDPVTLSGG
jgi:hypothetical protein